MKFTKLNAGSAGLIAAFGAVLLAGCDAAAPVDADGASQEEAAATLDPYLANPAEGDLWAAKLDEFSTRDFGQGGEDMGDAFGLMKVIQFDEDKITVITESAAWPVAESTVNELRGDLSGITWDESEEISINRADLASLVEKEHILETRRLEE